MGPPRQGVGRCPRTNNARLLLLLFFSSLSARVVLVLVQKKPTFSVMSFFGAPSPLLRFRAKLFEHERHPIFPLSLPCLFGGCGSRPGAKKPTFSVMSFFWCTFTSLALSRKAL